MKSESFFIDHEIDLRLTQLRQTYTPGGTVKLISN